MKIKLQKLGWFYKVLLIGSLIFDILIVEHNAHIYIDAFVIIMISFPIVYYVMILSKYKFKYTEFATLDPYFSLRDKKVVLTNKDESTLYFLSTKKYLIGLLIYFILFIFIYAVSIHLINVYR